MKYLAAGVSVNVQDTTPLTGAENVEEARIALYLRTKGGKRTGQIALGGADVDVDDHDCNHHYPRHLAVEEGHMEAVKILVEVCNYFNTLFGYSAQFVFLCVCVFFSFSFRGLFLLFQNGFVFFLLFFMYIIFV